MVQCNECLESVLVYSGDFSYDDPHLLSCISNGAGIKKIIKTLIILPNKYFHIVKKINITRFRL